MSKKHIAAAGFLLIALLSCTTTNRPSLDNALVTTRSLLNPLTMEICDFTLICLKDLDAIKSKLTALTPKLLAWEANEKELRYEPASFNTKKIPLDAPGSILAMQLPPTKDVIPTQRQGIREAIYAVRRGAFVVKTLFPETAEITIQRIFDDCDRAHVQGNCIDISPILVGDGKNPNSDISIEKSFWFFWGALVREDSSFGDARQPAYSSHVNEMIFYGQLLSKNDIIPSTDLRKIGDFGSGPFGASAWSRERAKNHDNHIHFCVRGVQRCVKQ